VEAADGVKDGAGVGVDGGVVGGVPVDVAVVIAGYNVDREVLGDGGEKFFDVDAFLDGGVGDSVFNVTENNEVVGVVGIDEFEEVGGHVVGL